MDASMWHLRSSPKMFLIYYSVLNAPVALGESVSIKPGQGSKANPKR
jgi:hypothetical protein